MKTYKVVAVIWDDHAYVDRGAVFNNPDDGIVLDISFGIVYEETDQTLMLVHNIEKYDVKDDASYTLILKSAIKGIQEYGNIDLEPIRPC